MLCVLLLESMSRETSHSPPLHLVPLGTGALDWEITPAATRKTLQSLGFEIASLLHASKTLLARARKATLPADVVALALRMPTKVGRLDLPESFALRVVVEDQEVRWIGPAEGENPSLSPVLLALFHLPALRGFWQRELRQSHFCRLRRVLPKAWFVTGDPPIGAVVADLGIASWKSVTDRMPIHRVQADGIEVAIERRDPSTAPLTLTYTRS